MAKSKKSGEPLPIRHASHEKETESRAILETVIKPWMIGKWLMEDYGIDAIVEITKPIASSKNQIVTGKRFSVQIKSTESLKATGEDIILSIPKEKINYWYNAIEPVLIILVDLLSERCFYRCIDDMFIAELFQQNKNWIAQETVTVHFKKDAFITSQKLLSIEEYIIHWKRPEKLVLSPGNYFRYSSEAINYIGQLSDKALQYNIPFFRDEITELKKQAGQSIYTVAIAGPSRAGKSTLINALLHQDISPVGILPTTGIPISIFPSDKNESLIIFKGGNTLKGTVESKFLEDYTSQAKDKNPDNIKGVKMVSINVVNDLLERGFALCDVPGLDDPDEEIRAITKTALLNVNAIIYVINTASMNDGGFSFTKQMIDDLKELGSRMDRLFVVFNKTDLLSTELIEQLTDHVSEKFEKYGILKYLPTSPFYLSAKNAYENRINESEKLDSVSALENSLWQYLLSHNKTGLHKILGTYADTKKIIEHLRTVLSSRLLKTDERLQVEAEISNINNEIPQLTAFVNARNEKIKENLKKLLLDSFSNIIRYLQNDLNSIPLTNPIHDESLVSNWLKDNAYKVFSSLYQSLDEEVFKLQIDINNWISARLKQVDIKISNESILKSHRMPDINNYIGHINLNFYGLKPQSNGILERLLNGINKLIENIAIVIGDIFTSDIKIRKREINEVLKKSRNSYKITADKFVINLELYLEEVSKHIEEKSRDRAQVYLGSLSSQLSKLDAPVSQLEKKNYKDFLTSLSVIDENIARNYIYLQEYTNGIGSMK